MLKNTLIYIRERFPLVPAVFFSILFGFSGIVFANDHALNITKICIASGMIFLFLLRIRLWDDIKDFHYDSLHHCARPVQKGVLSLQTIQTASLFVLCTELIIQLLLPTSVAAIFLIIVIYSLLMYNNFFIKNLEDKSFLLWLLSHQMIFFLYIYYIFSIGESQLLHINDTKILWMMISLFLPPLIYEIGRKVKHRTSHDGSHTNDTYIYRWGETRSYAFLFFILILQALSNFMIFRQYDILFLLQILSIIVIIVMYFTFRSFTIRTSSQWSIALGMYGLIILSIRLI